MLRLSIVTLLLLASPLWGQSYAYQFATSGGMPSSAFTVGVGAAVEIRVYLVETSQTVTLRNVGLATAGVQVQVDSFASITGMASNPQFEVVFPPPAPFTLAEATFNLAGVQSPADDPLRIWLGTYTFTGQTFGTATIQANGLAGFNMTLLNTGMPIDSRIVATTGTLTVVPEPFFTAVMLVVLMYGMYSIYEWRAPKERSR